VLRGQRKFDEALAVLDRAAALPGSAPAALFNKAIVLSTAQRYAEAEAVLDAALAAHPTPYLYRAKVSILTLIHGDLDAAARVLEKIPGAYLLEDGGAFAASQLWLWRREGDKAVKVWQAFTRDVVECAEFRGPKAFLLGVAHHVAGRPAAAEAEWKGALAFVESQLAAQPNALHWVYWRARLLASLGRHDEAAAALRTFEEMSGARGLTDNAVPIYLLLGRKDEVIAMMEKTRAAIVAKGNPVQLQAYENNLRFNHEWELVRDDPRVQALLAPPVPAPAEAKK
jgi:tetratricopeptide (TPR) repeat protein